MGLLEGRSVHGVERGQGQTQPAGRDVTTASSKLSLQQDLQGSAVDLAMGRLQERLRGQSRLLRLEARDRERHHTFRGLQDTRGRTGRGEDDAPHPRAQFGSQRLDECAEAGLRQANRRATARQVAGMRESRWLPRTP